MVQHIILTVSAAIMAAHSALMIGDYAQKAVPMENTHRLECDGLFLQLLQSDTVAATAFVREFLETERCDDVFNMSDCRQAYITRINADDPDRTERVMRFETDTRDELIVEQVREDDSMCAKRRRGAAPLAKLARVQFLPPPVRRMFRALDNAVYLPILRSQ
jgi:hypothetical protein